MKNTLKKALCLILVLLLALPAGLAEGVADAAGVADAIDSADAAEAVSGAAEPAAEEAGALLLGDPDADVPLTEDDPDENDPDADDPDADGALTVEEPAAEDVWVTVRIEGGPEGAVVTVRPAPTEDIPDPEAFLPDAGEAFLLQPGEYFYSVTAEGYAALEDVPFTVEAGEEEMVLEYAMEENTEVADDDDDEDDEEIADDDDDEVADDDDDDDDVVEEVVEEEPAEEEPEAPEAVEFEQSRTIGSVTVTVRAAAGAFPAGAELDVSLVNVQARRDADEAIGEIRDEAQNVAASYTYDIRVLLEGEEIQPAEGFNVEVAFSMARAADENLEANVYHVTEDEGGAMTAEKLEAETEDGTVTARSRRCRTASRCTRLSLPIMTSNTCCRATRAWP